MLLLLHAYRLQRRRRLPKKLLLMPRYHSYTPTLTRLLFNTLTLLHAYFYTSTLTHLLLHAYSLTLLLLHAYPYTPTHTRLL
jgi:hypothetical protein